MVKYLLINIAFLALVAGLVILLHKHLQGLKISTIGVGILLVLTALFDPLIIALGIVDYNTKNILGLYWLNTPIEDFFYAIAASILMPVLWRLYETRR